MRETDAILPQTIERGRFDILIPVAVNMIGTQRVDGYKENIGRKRLCLCTAMHLQECDNKTKQWERETLHGHSD